MNRLERHTTRTKELQVFGESLKAEFWTKIPCTVTEYDPETLTIKAQPMIQGSQRQTDGTFQDVDLPLLLDVPVLFPNAGDFSITFPIKEGDNCLVFFADRCIDFWHESGEISPARSFRMHDLSDGFAYFGPRPKTKIPAEVSTENFEIRNEDGTLKILMTPDKTITAQNEGGTITLDNEGNLTMTLKGAHNITADGDLSIEAQGSASITCNEATIEAQSSVTASAGSCKIEMSSSQVAINGYSLTVKP